MILKGFQSYCKIAAVFLVLIFTCWSADAQTRKGAGVISSAKTFIVAGKSVGRINVGDALNRIFQLYPKLKRADYSPARGCDFSSLELLDSLTVVIKGERVVQITVKNNYPKVSSETTEKIQPGSPAASVKKSYPNADKAFTKLSETYSSTGYEPLIYWVDKNTGIAFEFYTDPIRGRLVNAIHIFAPGDRFLFNDGCDDNEDLRELPSFATKVPDKMIRDYQR